MAIALLISFTATAFFTWQLPTTREAPGPPLAGFVVLIGTSFFLFQWLVLGHVFWLGVMLLIFCFLCPWRLVYAAAALLTMVLAYQKPYVLIRDTARFREQFPLESMTARLDVWQANAERNRPVPQRDVPAVAETSTAHTPGGRHERVDYEVALRKAYEIEPSQVGRRRLALEVIHETWRIRFQAVMGNGFARMRWMPGWRDFLYQLPAPPELYPFDVYAPADEIAAASRVWNNRLEQIPSASPESLLHLRSVADFIHPGGWGFTQNRHAHGPRTAGFQSHHFRHRPVFIDGDATQHPSPWRIVRLELMSLGNGQRPFVYDSPQLPNLEELRDGKSSTRTANAFERAALAELRSGEDLVIQESEHEIRMVGSLRAIDQCTNCHRVETDELLGAFTYELRAAPAAAAEQPVSTDSK